MSTRALPERYRRASNIHEGYEIRTTEGEWLRVKHALHIYAPAKISRFELEDEVDFPLLLHPDEEVMSRRASMNSHPGSDWTPAHGGERRGRHSPAPAP